MKCCFVGHRDIVGISDLVYAEIKRLISFGIIDFYSGGMGNFDKICEKAVKELGGKLTFVPYNMKMVKDEHAFWYDSIECPFEKKAYSKYDIPNRNRWLIDNCNIVLCYVYRGGGAKHTLDYAVKRGKIIINLYKPQK